MEIVYIVMIKDGIMLPVYLMIYLKREGKEGSHTTLSFEFFSSLYFYK